MNQSKKIEFNKSTLLSLKAELLRKQSEVKDVKHLPKHQIDNFKPTPPVRDKDGKSKKFEPTTKEITEVEDEETLRKSRVMLEKKATLYDHLNDRAGTSQLGDRYLVDFHKKTQEMQLESSHRSDEDVSTEITQDFDDDVDDGWVEYTDCLGRTRKCHKTDLEFLKKKDEDLKNSLNKSGRNKDDTKEPVESSLSQEEQSAPPKSATEATDAYKEQLRRKWEEKELLLLQSEKDVHYQDLLFNEARAHGVGYYAFSESESARAREQNELRRAHDETKLAQKEVAARREERNRLIEERVQAARARRRVREGLPPEDEKEKRDKITAQLLDFVDEQRKAYEAKATEELRQLREEKEKERQKERENYIREWDLGKDGVQKGERFREMTQEEWVAKQRDVRNEEFAPVGDRGTFGNKDSQMTFDNKGHWIGAGPSNQKRTWAEVRPVQQTEPVNDQPSCSFSQGGLYFTTSKKKLEDIKNKYQSSETGAFVPTLIDNEISDEEDVTERKKSRHEVAQSRSGVEIAPPPTFEYYGPSSDGKPAAQPGPSKSAVNESIEKGLNYLKDEKNKGKQKKEIGFLS